MTCNIDQHTHIREKIIKIILNINYRSYHFMKSVLNFTNYMWSLYCNFEITNTPAYNTSKIDKYIEKI